MFDNSLGNSLDKLTKLNKLIVSDYIKKNDKHNDEIIEIKKTIELTVSYYNYETDSLNDNEND